MQKEYEYDEKYYEDELTHYGMPRRSGRYPWGSGKETYQRTGDFLSRIDTFKSQGMSEKDIATAFGLTTTQMRVQESLAKSERRSNDVATAKSMRDRGLSLNQIAKEMGFKNDSSVRSLLNEESARRMNESQTAYKILKENIDKKGMIDVGAGVERELGVSKEKLNQALYMLELEGYPTFTGGVQQVTNAGKQTVIKVVGPPGTEHKDIYDYSKVNTIKDYNTMTGEVSVQKFQYPTSIDGKRIHIRYAEDGGVERDGTIELKRGVPDLDLGNSHYAQVRILVDNKSYLKGMAVYKDDADFPPGTDIIFNTNKSKGTAPEKVFKDIKNDPDNPFGSSIPAKGQSTYIDANGKRVLSPINKAREEGDWNEWSKGLPSQFLSKQKEPLIRKQLSLAKADKLAELEEILSIPNPTIKKNLLKSFSDDCDSSAVHLKAASLPRQKYQVILPISSLKDTEVYAPNFKEGEKIALIRYPHGGTFEIPILTVTTKNKEAIKMLGKNPKDALAINSKVAERLSGADFDGDTVQAIPVGRNKQTMITNKSPLKDLEGFDNKREYPAREGTRLMQKGSVGREMGVISNLITDMTIGGATDAELARAVKHSMVVIDAYKHKLDYKKSEQDQGIQALKNKYQAPDPTSGKTKGGGASTLLSRAKGEARVDKRVGTPKVNLKGKSWYDPSKPEGALIYKTVRETYIDGNGKEQVRQIKSTKMMETDDARTLSSGTMQESLYADYANSMKAMANTARKAMATTGNLKMDPIAKKTYAKEVSSLNAKLNMSLLNAPKERQAQLLANSVVSAKRKSNPGLEGEDLKKLKQRELSIAREKFGAKRKPIVITDEEWTAIEKGAISENTLNKILQNADMENIRSKATPRQGKTLSPAKLAKLQAMKASGYTNQEIAESLKITASLVAKY